MRWNYRRYGTALDPVHKSHLTSLMGDYGCPRQFRYEMDARASGVERDAQTRSVSGMAAAGTAAHETIARALSNPLTRSRVLAGKAIDTYDVNKVFRHELAREIGARDVAWYDDDAEETIRDRVAMITNLLARMHEYVADITLIEPGFIVPLGAYWLSGHVDLIYRPRSNPEAYALADWKTGASKPSDLELDHGWEAGVYSTAVHAGLFLPREALEVRMIEGGSWRATCESDGRVFGQATHPSRYIAERNALEAGLIDMALGHSHSRALAFEAFPAEIYHVHLADYVPYKKAGAKVAKRPEDLKFYGLESSAKVKYAAGQLRGPAWLPVRRTAHDIPRLESRLRSILGMVRMGCFIDQVGEKCRRCAFAGECLTSGYEVRGDEAKQLEAMVRPLGEVFDDGLTDLKG
jgi:hypothetical protein